MYVCMFVCKCLFVCVGTYVNIYVYVCMSLRVRVCMYVGCRAAQGAAVCMYVCFC